MYDEESLDLEEAELNDEIIRAKWAMDGATSLTEAAEMLRSYADWLLELEAQGWRLRFEIDNDYGYLFQVNSDGVEIQGASLT